jgi:acetyl esterase/lipase
VIALLNAYYVPVYISNEDYSAKSPAVPPDEIKIQRKIYLEALKEKRDAGSVCVYLVDPDGKGLASMIVSTAAAKDNLRKLLEATADKLKVPAGKPVVPPAPQACGPAAGPTDLVLHLVARVDHRGSWGQFPSENWIVLGKDQWSRWLPAVAKAKPGQTWSIAMDDAVPVLTYFFPQTEICNFAKAIDADGPYQHRFEELTLHGKVLSVNGGKVRARLDGSLKLKHKFYPNHDDDNYVVATVVGYMDYDQDAARIQSLQVVTQEATYGKRKFAAAVRVVQGPAFGKKTVTYKEAGGVKVQADVYRAEDSKVRPGLVWIHGGALIMGSRTGVPKNLLELCQREGYVLVSIDYRLAPEVKLPAIIEDLKDALGWIRKEGPKLFHIDPERIVVAGGSAGGYLTMMSGICVDPPPRALVAYWGYGDVDGDWYTKPSAHYREKTPLVAKEDAYKAVGGPVLTGTDGKTGPARGQYYRYLRQNGLWTKEVTGFDPATDRAKLEPFCPVRNITAKYPPILMVHGTADTDVPYQLSADMAKELARCKVEHELITVQGAEHGLAGGDPKLVADAHARALAFIRKHLQ